MSGYCSLQASSAPSSDAGAMHLAERGGGGGMMLEARETCFCQSAPELGRHAPLDEGPAHRRRLALQLHAARRRIPAAAASGMVAMSWATFMIGPLRPPSAAASSIAFLPRSSAEAEQPRAGDARRDAAHIGADARIARGAGGEAVGFAVGHGSMLSARDDHRADSRSAGPRWRAHAFGQLSRIQRVRLSSLTSPAASARIIAVASAGHVEINPVQSEEDDHGAKAARLLPSTNG